MFSITTQESGIDQNQQKVMNHKLLELWGKLVHTYCALKPNQ